MALKQRAISNQLSAKKGLKLKADSLKKRE
jgi:hypothetical protein